jgi:hypothetical protein
MERIFENELMWLKQCFRKSAFDNGKALSAKKSC